MLLQEPRAISKKKKKNSSGAQSFLPSRSPSYLLNGNFLPMAASGSCWRMALIAVGAVNMEEAPCSDMTRKKAPGSGVPTGLP